MAPLALFPTDLALWSLVVGAIGCAVMGIDKAMAIWGEERISEKTLWLTALAGGFWGIILGALVFRHKTSKGSFWPPVALATLLWLLMPVLVVSGVLTA